MENDSEMDPVNNDDVNMEEDNDNNIDDDDGESTTDDENPDSAAAAVKDVYLPGKPLADDEELVCDESAYIMLHQAHTGAPCLSFDILKDDLGDNRKGFPMTSFIVAGTQAAKTHVNNVIVMKMSNLFRTSKDKTNDEDDSSDDESSASDDEDLDNDGKKIEKKPNMDCALIKHKGCVNRIRATNIHSNTFAATWSELGIVNIWDITEQLLAVNDTRALKTYEDERKGDRVQPIFSFNGHQQEGYGIDWNPCTPGVLASGDCRHDIHIWHMKENTWIVDQRPLIGHTDSVEDLQWSPNESSVLASCSVDKSIRIWDCRAPPAKACMLTCENAHSADINVINWNRNEPLIASGGDDGILHIWDLRQFQTKTPIATFKHHTNSITTVEWQPSESTLLATGGTDDQIAIWDLGLEEDVCPATETPVTANASELTNLPPQLLFIHQGQTDIKELHWHPQIPGLILSTAHSGFNVFQTISTVF